MALLVRIKLPSRSEARKIIRTKRDNFDLFGDNYVIDYNCTYLTTIWGGLVKIQCLDYEKGVPEPIRYFGSVEERKRMKMSPATVSDIIRRLFEDIPHFQIIVLILLVACIAAAGIAAYMAYDAGNKISDFSKVIVAYINGTRGGGLP